MVIMGTNAVLHASLYENELPEIQDWYDGYRFGGIEIYNPWSVINFFDQGHSGDYWTNTSGNSILYRLLQYRSMQQERDLYALLKGRNVQAVIRESLIYDDLNRDKDALYSMLRATNHEAQSLPQAEGYSRRCRRFDIHDGRTCQLI